MGTDLLDFLDYSPMSIYMCLMAGALINYGLIAKHWVWPRIKTMPRKAALQPLLQLEGFRYLGLCTLAPSQVSGELPRTWAHATALGDLTSAVLALISLYGLRAGWKRINLWLWAFFLIGSYDLMQSFIVALQLKVPDQAGSMIYIISTLYAPAGLITLVLIGMLLCGRGQR